MEFWKHAMLLGLTLATACAGATVVVEHVGSALPGMETPAWGSHASSGCSASPVNDDGTPALNVYDGNNNAWDAYIYFSYESFTTEFQDPSGWTLSARMRVVQSAFESPTTEPACSLTVSTGARRFLFDFIGTDLNPAVNGVWFMGSAGPGQTNVAGEFVQLAQMDTTNRYHWYQLVFDPATADRVTFYVDGKRSWEIMNENALATSTMAVAFGSASSPDMASANWNVVRFETGIHLQEPPVSLALVRTNTQFWLTWSASATGYHVETSTTLTTWTDPHVTTNAFTNAGSWWLRVPADLLDATNTFFRLAKPASNP